MAEDKINPQKKQAMEAGYAAGEAYALKLFATGGVAVMAATLEPEAESWEQDALNAFYSEDDDVHGEQIHTQSIHPYYFRAYCQMFANAARRLAEMFVCGARDAEAGKPVVELATQRLGKRQSLVDAYKAGHATVTPAEADSTIALSN